jgi:DNA-binding beta-propeller fold protein YncE
MRPLQFRAGSALLLILLTMVVGGVEPSRPQEALPQLYRTVRNWGQFTDVQGIIWPGAVTAIEPDGRGHIYVVYRCHENTCADRNENPILKFDTNGKLLTQWGSGLFVFPHGATVDRDGNLWVTDAGGASGKGHQVFKFSPDGRVLMTLGQAGVAGNGPAHFNQPTDVAIAPNGDIFVADGHRDPSSGSLGNNRIVHFSADGRFVKEFGHTGSGPGELREPHALAFDSLGRLFVADRVNNRIELFDQSGRFLEQWTQFGRPSGLSIDARDTLYVSDSESGPDTGVNETTRWRKGIRIGSARTGKLTSFIEDMQSVTAAHSGAEGIGVDAAGNVYGAVVARKMLEKHVLASKSVAPRFEVDPLWPKPLPNHWVMGWTVGVAVDAQDHIWVIHRQGSLEPNEVHAATNPPIAACCVPAPPVLEFDQAGNLLNAWGGPGEGYDWPLGNHGITVDYKGNVWIGGNGTAPATAAFSRDDMLLKFTRTGKFLLQIGKPGQSQGNSDTRNLRLPAKIFVDPKRNEAFVADGYGNRRVIVFDADTGAFKRQWGAYGNAPSDADPGPYVANQTPAQQFRSPVHCAMLSHDDLLYVCDRLNDRIQVFRPDGTFVKEAFFETQTLGQGSAWDLAFSADPAQRFIYLSDGENRKVRIIDRQSLEVLTSFGDGGRQPGQFYGVHSIATDSKGNIYTTETYTGQRVQKFLFKGLAPVSQPDQGVVWPSAASSRGR